MPGPQGNSLEADTPTRTQAGLCHSPSRQGAVVCLGLYVGEAARRPISKMLPLGALLSGGGRGGGQRPRGGETQPAPGAWEQEQLCGTVNKGRGCGGRRVPGLGVGGLRSPGWELGGPPAPAASVWPWPLRRGTHCSGGGGRETRFKRHNGALCVGRGGAGPPAPAHRPTFPCFAPSWPNAWVPGVGDGRELLARIPPGDGGWGPALLETPRIRGRRPLDPEGAGAEEPGCLGKDGRDGCGPDCR